MTHFATHGAKAELPSSIKIYQEIVENAQNGFDYEIRHLVTNLKKSAQALYFQDLKEWLTDVRLQEVNIKWVYGEIWNYNEKVLSEFMARTDEAIAKFQQTEHYKKLGHLEEYEVTDTKWAMEGLIPVGKYQYKRIETNYKYYCIEEIPKLLDFDFFRDYIDILSPIVENFRRIAVKYIKMYDEGKFTESNVIQVNITAPALPAPTTMELPPPEMVKKKIKVTLSVPQLAYLFRLLYDGKPDIFKDLSPADLFRFVAANFSTKSAPEISPDSVSNHFYTIDRKTAEFWTNHLKKMLEQSRKE
jgi:hypothetical protein